MPRIPILDSRSVMPQQQRDSSPLIRQPDFDAARTVQGITQDAMGAGAQIARGMEEDRRAQLKANTDANNVLITDGLLEQGNRFNGGFAELKKQRGLSAMEKRNDVIERLDKDRQEIAGGITDTAARQHFLVRSGEQLAAYRTQVEHYVSGQFDDARDATTKARQSQFLSMTEGGVANFEAWDLLRNQTREDIRNNAESPQVAEAQLSAFDSATAESWTRSLLAQGRITEAETYVKENQETLGGRFVETSTAVAQAMKGAEREMQKAEAIRNVAGVMEKSKSPDGYLDESKAVAAFNQLDPEEQQNAMPQFRRAVSAEALRKKADIDGWKKSASGQLNNGGFAAIDGKLIENLNVYDPDYLRRLRNEDELRTDRAHRRAKGHGNAKGEAKNDRLWLARFNKMAADQRASVDVDDFVMGHGVTELGAETIKVFQRRTIEGLQRGDARAADSFADDLTQEVRNLTKKTRGKRPELTVDEADEYRTRALESYAAFVEEKKRSPNQAERDSMRREVIQTAVTKPVSTPREPIHTPLGDIPLPDKTEQKKSFSAVAAPAKPSGGFITIVDDNGEELDVDASKADALLKKYPTYRRK